MTLSRDFFVARANVWIKIAQMRKKICYISINVFQKYNMGDKDMHLKKGIRQGISTMLIAAMSFGNVMSVMADTPSVKTVSSENVTVKNGNYRATVNFSEGQLGGVLRSKSSDVNADWNTMTETMVPGMTMYLDETGTAKKADVSAKNTLTTGDGSIGASGVELTGDLTGVKSYFMFPDEIVYLGAGLKDQKNSDDKIITVVDNVPVTTATRVSIPNPKNGYYIVINQAKAGGGWEKAVDTATKGVHARNWLSASDLSGTGNPLQWKYLFTDSITNSNVYYRFPTKGNTVVQSFELWMAGTQYQYTVKAGGRQTDFNGQTTVDPDTNVLSNSNEIQAAESLTNGILAVNKWSDGTTELTNNIANVTLNQPMSMLMKKDESIKTTQITVGKPSNSKEENLEFTVHFSANQVTETSGEGALVSSDETGDGLHVKLDAAKMTKPVTLEVSYQLPDIVDGDVIEVVRGNEKQVELPTGFNKEGVTWSAKFVKPDGTYLRNAGSSKKKYELPDGETDGTRTAGDTSADHLVTVKKLTNGNAIITGKEKGSLVLVAKNTDGTEKKFKVEVLYTVPENLPKATEEDYAKIRKTWKESIVGVDLANEEGGAEILASLDEAAETAWNAYAYKGESSCPDIPWKADEGAAGVASTPYVDDAAEFRPAFKKVLSMATAYAADGSKYYQNQEMLKDMTNILDYLCTVCYTPKTQTNNWWTWEIGIPKDLIPILMLIYDGLTPKQVNLYTEAMYFFQPDPYHEGAIGTASTHVNGYRTAQGANIIDCSTTAVGLGALRKDSEQLYMGSEASSGTFVIQTVEDSSKLAADGYASGFYADGSYMDHSRVPYLGAYGIEFMKGGVKIPSLIGGTPWQYSGEVQKNLEYYIVNGFGSSMYRGLMLDSLKGRSVSRKSGSNQAAGREAMVIILQMIDSLSDEAKETMLSTMKYWMEQNPGFVDGLEGVENLAIKKRAREILEDSSIVAAVEPLHKSFPYMDRAVHRMDDYLFAVSMYSERTQNTEIMNDENRMGWHQNNGMTYIYDSDQDQYTDNFWNTVNPLRLPGTTVVPVNIGTGTPDSSGYAQGGDYCSNESWVGGSTIGNYGISGMSFSGAIANKAKSTDGEITYAPNLKGKKSWFMFENEIVCLGAGIQNKGMDLPVETTIENRRLGTDGENAFVVNGEETNLPMKEANIKELAEHSADVSGTEFDGAEWAHLEGNGTSSGTGYYFPEEGTSIRARRARNTGNWSDIGTTEGESTQNYLEMWFDHGKNPTNGSYSYVLLPETGKEETENYAKAPQVTVLANTSAAQAVYQKELGITGINFWEDKETTVGEVTCDSQASVMMQEGKDGRLRVAVSDPTMKNKGTITLKINRPITDMIDSDSDISCRVSESGAELTFNMAGTNGSSVYAELQLKASIYPYAVTLKKGDEQTFELRDFNLNEEVAWSVATDMTRMRSNTTIDENGVLKIDEEETDGALVVTAETASGLKLHAYVSLGKDAAIDTPDDLPLPEEMQNLQKLIDKALDDPDGTEVYDENAIKKAVKAVQDADTEKVAEYLMDSVLKLAEVYQQVWENNGREIGEDVETVGIARELEPVDAKGMILSIYPSLKVASPSNAVLVIKGEEDAAVLSETELSNATPSNATPSNAVAKTAVFSTETLEKIGDKPIVKDSLCEYVLSLVREYNEDQDSRNLLPLKTPIKAEISVPDQLDSEKPILAAVADADGTQHPLEVTVNEDGSAMTFVLTRMGTLILANQAEEQEKPDTPNTPEKPDDPNNPNNPEKPDDPWVMTYEVFIDDEITGGTVTADHLTGPEGTKITLIAKANLGYRLNYLQVNGKTVKTTAKGTYTFKLKQDTEVTASFVKLLAITDHSDRNDRERSDSEGWVRSGNGWKYQIPGGSYAKNGWQQIGGIWYAFDANGIMRTGWYLEAMDNCWYYMKPDGSMAIGWQQINGKWYYFNPATIGITGWNSQGLTWNFDIQKNQGIPQGAMYKNQRTPDGYLVDEQGAWIQ